MTVKVVMMKCGHAANAVDGNGNPVCAICYGIKSAGREVVETPDLTGRTAKCSCCPKTVESTMDLPFFSHHAKAEFDGFYCGCRGWE